jgi:hypothetical protein
MHTVSIGEMYYRCILTVPNVGNHISFNIKEENDHAKAIGSNYDT